MKKLKRITILLFTISIPLTVIGYFLQTILIPVQDFHTMTPEQVLDLQKEVAINYPVGTFLLFGGLLVISISVLFLSFYLIRLLIIELKSLLIIKRKKS